MDYPTHAMGYRTTRQTGGQERPNGFNQMESRNEVTQSCLHCPVVGVNRMT